MLFNGKDLDFYLGAPFATDWEAEKEEMHIHHKHLILSMMEPQDISRLIFVANREGNIEMQESLERELRSRKFQDGSSVNINDLKNSVDIVYILENYTGVPWRRGQLLKCPLPGHQDGTPSFSVNRERGRFMCFGCGKKGSVIDLVMEMDGVSLSEAIKKLKGYM